MNQEIGQTEILLILIEIDLSLTVRVKVKSPKWNVTCSVANAGLVAVKVAVHWGWPLQLG